MHKKLPTQKGGNYTDWELSSSNGWTNVGFPIAECYADGSFVLTKPNNTGGIVNVFTAGEQVISSWNFN